jgi:hypothetical protein
MVGAEPEAANVGAASASELTAISRPISPRRGIVLDVALRILIIASSLLDRHRTVSHATLGHATGRSRPAALVFWLAWRSEQNPPRPISRPKLRRRAGNPKGRDWASFGQESRHSAVGGSEPRKPRLPYATYMGAEVVGTPREPSSAVVASDVIMRSR